MAIDKSSPEFMFGQILQRLNQGDKTMEGFREQIAELTKAINGLPCGLNQRRISTLEAWREKMNGLKEFKNQAIIKFRHAIIISIITAVLTGLATFLATSITG